MEPRRRKGTHEEKQKEMHEAARKIDAIAKKLGI